MYGSLPLLRSKLIFIIVKKAIDFCIHLWVFNFFSSVAQLIRSSFHPSFDVILWDIEEFCEIFRSYIFCNSDHYTFHIVYSLKFSSIFGDSFSLGLWFLTFTMQVLGLYMYFIFDWSLILNVIILVLNCLLLCLLVIPFLLLSIFILQKILGLLCLFSILSLLYSLALHPCLVQQLTLIHIQISRTHFFS